MNRIADKMNSLERNLYDSFTPKQSKISKQTFLLFFCTIMLLFSCEKKGKPQVDKSEKHFTLIDAAYSGIQFENSLTETKTENHLINEKFVNGGGVAIGDINNDGLPDIYFSGNQVQDRLYLNKGNMQFEDITEKAGIDLQKTWSTGVTFVDINADGFEDIYVCKSARDKFELGQNVLYVNRGDMTFTELAYAYKLDDAGFSIQANFFDYNKDGLIDMYLINQPPAYGNRKGGKSPMKSVSPRYSDKLFKNLGPEKGFVEVSTSAKVQNLAHGLSAAIGDVTNDGWSDVYVANDYEQPDYMYVNMTNGTFENRLNNAFGHISNFSMGSDIADYDNDGHLDIVVVDMVAEDHKRIKTNMGGMQPEDFWAIVENGGYYQYMFNTLQRNNGNGTFSDVAQLGGVSNTDWSWSPLLADFDNDGFKDLFVTNGIKRNMRYSDVNTKSEKILDSIQAVSKSENKRFQDLVDVLALAQMAPEDKLNNYIYKNNGDLTFTNKIMDWGFDLPSLSNGAAYADFDLDGDLDLVINNIDSTAFLYRNNTVERSLGNYLQLQLKPDNQDVIYGARVKLFQNNELWQMIELTNVRGYMSKSDDIVHFGLGSTKTIDKIEITWSDGTSSELKDVKTNQRLLVNKQTRKPTKRVASTSNPKPYFKEVLNSLGEDFKHIENEYNDFQKEVLLPHKMSQFGPYISVGDVNADGLDDFFIGGSAGISGVLFLQKKDSSFIRSSQQPWMFDRASEDMGNTFFDVDNDGDLDLFVVSGGNEFKANSKALKDRLYLNNGKGVFKKALDRVPDYRISGSVVEKADYDNDGDIDLFIGGRLQPGNYPYATDSKLLENRNGTFVDVTQEKADKMIDLGLVTSATWTDINKDGLVDLVVVGEWMPVTIFIQNKIGAFEKQKFKGLENTEGWYYSVISEDIDDDGDEDLVLGNLGLNYKYKATADEPFELYSYDFDKNGSNDIVLSYHEDGELFPIRGRSCSIQQIPSLGDKFPTFASFGDADLHDIYGADLQNALHLKANTFASYYVENIDGNAFKMHELPKLAQVSSINAIVAQDFDKDGIKDILISGNLYASEIETPRNDASIGLFLKGKEKGGFQAVSPSASGFFVPYDAKSMQTIQIGGRSHILIGNNSDKLQTFRVEN